MSVDVSGLIELIDSYALEKLECLGQTFERTAADNAPKDTGNLAAGITWSGASGGGGHGSGSVESTTVGDQGFDYGVIQNDGDAGVSGTLMAAEIDGELRFFTSRAGVPATHFWDDTIAAWGDIIGECEG